MSSLARPFSFLFAGAAVLSLTLAGSASAYEPIATAKQVTNTKNNNNLHPTLDKKAQVMVFVSNSDHVSGVSTPTSGAFDYDDTGNDFANGDPSPAPSCVNCTSVDDNAGNLYMWVQKKKYGQPANTVKQLTFSSSGGIDANEFPDIDSKAKYAVWNSEDDHTGGNADGNSEIFLMDLETSLITQITDTTGGSGNANTTATLDAKARVISFASTRDFNAVVTCRRPDTVSVCFNPDENREVMFYDIENGTFTQVTDTTGDGNDANDYPRVSPDANYIAFRTTRDFSGPLSGGATCEGVEGAACSNDGNGEIMVYDREELLLKQVTNTINQSGCNGKDASDRPEISKKAKYLVFESECEDQLNPTGCGDCNNNREVFFYAWKPQEIAQITISDGGYNEVPRISASGKYIVWETNRDYMGLNPGTSEAIYIIKRGSTKLRPNITGVMQVEDDSTLLGGGIVQNPKTQATTVQFFGGMPADERIGISGNGRFFAFESSKDVGNQEVWLVDRNKCTHGLPDCL